MPLNEPYQSPFVHCTTRLDPSQCPVAGRRTNGQPVPRHVSATVLRASSTNSSTTADALMSLKAFNRLKHQPDPDMHFAGKAGAPLGRFDVSSTHAGFGPIVVPPRRSKYDWNATVPPKSLSGVGVSVPKLDGTNTWLSTRAAEIDRSERPRTTLVDKTYRAVSQGRRLESWASNTTASFSSSSLMASAKDVFVARQDFLASRGTLRPLMSLA